MFVVRYDKLTPEQEGAWRDLLTTMRHLQEENGDGTGWLFHGTHHLAANCIAEVGFVDLWTRDLPQDRTEVYFGNLAIAQSFAERNMDADSPPCILAVRTADVAHALTSDQRYDGWLPDWRDNVAAGGTVKTTADVAMPSLVRYGIEELGLPLHPNAPYARRERIRHGGPMHPDDMVDPDHLPLAELDHEPNTPESFFAELEAQFAASRSVATDASLPSR